MKPMIGITASLEANTIKLQRENGKAIEQAGGLPVILPYVDQQDTVDELVGRLDGLLLSGGGDIDPFLFGEEPIPGLGSITPDRDWLEGQLIHRFLESGKPILGICRGCQILNVIAGGGMYQDIYSQKKDEGLLQHVQRAPRDHVSHLITMEKGSLLSRIFVEDSVKVNSFHHQAVGSMAPGFIVSARSSDGLIEAFESINHPFVLGVQWHPEDLFHKYPSMAKLFLAFVSACRKQN